MLSGAGRRLLLKVKGEELAPIWETVVQSGVCLCVCVCVCVFV